MPDAIETAAFGPTSTAPAVNTFANDVDTQQQGLALGDHVGKLDSDNFTVLPTNGNAGNAGQSDTNGIQTPQQNPELEAMRKSLLGDYTRKSQAVADERRRLDTERQQMATMLQQMAQQGQTPQQATRDRGILERLPQSIQSNLDPQSAQVLETIGLMVNDIVQDRMGNYQAQTQQMLNQAVNPIAQQVRAQQLSTEYNQLAGQLGQDKMAPHQQAIVDTLARNPQLNVAQALNQVAPNVLAEHFMDLGRKQALETLKQQQDANLYGGEPGPSSNAVPKYRPGESMRDTVARLYGTQGKSFDQPSRALMRDYIDQGE